MITYIVRRILYSIPVLIVSTFLSFTFVSLAGQSDARAEGEPALLAAHGRPDRGALPPQRPDPGPLLLLGAGRLHAQARQLALDAAADLARHHAHDGPHGAVHHPLRDPRDHPRRRRRHLLGDPPVLAVRLLVHDVQLPRLRDADVLARAAAADPVRRHLPEVERADLLHVGAQQPASRDVVARPAAASRRCRSSRSAIISFARLQPVHARLDARRDQQRLRAHRAREGGAGAQDRSCATSSATR